MNYSDFNAVTAGIREWAAGAPEIEAAAELLIWHKGWLRRGDFLRACVQAAGPGSPRRINWAAAREFSDRVTGGGLDAPRASTSEAAILDLAVALGEDRFRLGNFGRMHRWAAAQAFAAACGHTLAGEAPERGHDHPDFIPGTPETCGACAREAKDGGHGRSVPAPRDGNQGSTGG